MATNLRIVIAVALLLICARLASAQEAMYRITFVDKGPDRFAPGTPSYLAALAEFSPRALERRRLHGKVPVLDSADQPLYDPYLTTLKSMGIYPMAPVRLRNCVIAFMDTTMALTVQGFTFVKRVQRTKERAYVRAMETAEESTDCEPRRYGQNDLTHKAIGTDLLHRYGLLGQGVIVGVIDNGFRDREHSSLAHLDVLGRYDVVEDQPDDLNGHGTIIMSIIAGNAQDTLIGMAPYASYLLARSEDQRFERRQEEDNFCSALEWVERNGADIATFSIGYRRFDDGEEPSPSYDDFDGRTTFPSVAVNRAVSLGLTCVTAMGNNGPAPRTLITPADADSVVAVGATSNDGIVMEGSSRGPTADGRIKPDIAATGVSILSLGLGNQRYIRSSGTSLAAPQIAGGLALLKQLAPSARTWELRNAMYMSATHPDGGDSALGHGVPNFRLAAKYLGPCFGPRSTFIENDRWTMMLGVLAIVPSVQYMVRTKSGISTLQYAEMREPDLYTIPLDSLRNQGDTIEIRIKAEDGATGRVSYYPSDSTWLKVTTTISIACGVDIPSTISGIDVNNADERYQNVTDISIGSRGRPVAVQQHSRITLPGIINATMMLTDITGRSTPLTPDAANSVTLTSVSAGWYILSATNGVNTYTLPIIIGD